MATLVLSSVGTALGGPLGGALGALVGQSIDQQLFGPGIRKGPRLGDLSVQTSSYGSPIPRIYGTMRVAGTVIWATDLKEEEVIEGGGKSGPEQVRYSYSVSLAVALSSRPIRAIRRIWADGKLIRGADGDFKVRTKFRLRRGDQDQQVDPLIASVEALSNTPAYRGLALAVFEDLELVEFGSRIPILTFETEADDEGLLLADLLADASGGLIGCNDDRPIPGFAGHGSSIGDSLHDLIELAGVDLVDKDGRLLSPAAAPVILLPPAELGCDGDGEPRAAAEQVRAEESERPTTLALTYYDPDRDYQTGQVRSTGGDRTGRDERIELPAVLTAAKARQMVEEALARRWRTGDRLRVRLPPSRMDLRPGLGIQIEGLARVWLVRSVTIEGMAAQVEAYPAPVTIPPLPAEPGRSVSEPDVVVGRSRLALFELPSLRDAPEDRARIHVAATNAGLWKTLPVEVMLDNSPLANVAMTRRAVLGAAESALDPRAPLILDERSSVIVRLFNPAHYLLNADHEALMAGANLAMIGDELVQFGRAEQISDLVYRLSGLLRGRRGTEWAAGSHSVGEPFCMADPLAIRPVDLGTSAVGASLIATAHGIGDISPLPVAERMVSGESLRPPSPCHLRLWAEGAALAAQWVRRSYRGWAWSDGVGDGADPFPELYRLVVTGPGGQLTAETAISSAAFAIDALPAAMGQPVTLSVSTVGPAALSRPATATIIV